MYKSAGWLGDTCKAWIAQLVSYKKRVRPTKNEPQQGISYLERERDRGEREREIERRTRQRYRET